MHVIQIGTRDESDALGLMNVAHTKRFGSNALKTNSRNQLASLLL